MQFNEIITIKDNYKFKLSPPIKNLEWKDFFYNQYNNSINFNYNTNNKSIFKAALCVNVLLKNNFAEVIYIFSFVLYSVIFLFLEVNRNAKYTKS